MTTTYPLNTLAAVISDTGITAPTYNDIYQSLLASFKLIYGPDIYVAPDSQDGQLLALFALSISDSNDALIAAYNAYSPSTAQGAALSNQVRINGLTRQISSNSSVVVDCVGQVGTIIINGIVADSFGNNWELPASVTIPGAGTIAVTATAQKTGEINVPSGTVTKIQTPTRGWQSVNNAAASSPGDPIESDAVLRVRQSHSVASPSQSLLAGMIGALEAVTGVVEVVAYENSTGTTDSNGFVAHSIGFVIQGGDSTAIANTLLLRKTPGAYIQGTTAVTVVDQFGLSNTMRYYVAQPKNIKIEIDIKPLVGYNTDIGNQIVASLISYVNALKINQSVFIPRLYLPAQLFGGLNSDTYEILYIKISYDPDAVGTTDLTIAFDHMAKTDASKINLIVTP